MIDRRGFFWEAVKKAGKFGFELFEESKTLKYLESLGQNKRKERPPGAHQVESKFLELCTGCDACMAACPVNIIMIENLDRRDPVIYPDEGPCIHCDGYPCIAVCPTGALHEGNLR